ncbi:hypothetical protein LLG96_09265 [bacterium]|nr:hypothetical protein [bacterium]
MTDFGKVIVTVLCGLAIILTGCSKDSSTNSSPTAPEDILTRDDEISGWGRSGGSWTASSSSELNTHIDGEEPLYNRHGFVEAAMQRYEGTVLGRSTTVEARIFDQGSQENVQALMEELILQLVNPINLATGDEGKLERFPLSQKILFRKSKYLVSLTITSGLDEALDVLKTFAVNIDKRIP